MERAGGAEMTELQATELIGALIAIRGALYVIAGVLFGGMLAAAVGVFK